MVILSIADIHLDLKDNRDLSQTNIEGFTHKLRKLCESDKSWQPDFICICGDIINKGNSNAFHSAKKVLQDIALAANISPQCIMMVPGNHDITTANIENPAVYLANIKSWLNGTTRQLPAQAQNAIKPYMEFRNEFLDKTPSDISQFNALFKDGSGCRVFEDDKIVFIELNSSWCDIRNITKGKPHNTLFRKLFRKAKETSVPMAIPGIKFNKEYINLIFSKIQRYKRQGYYVVVLSHHSPRLLDTEQYAEYERINIYDRIIDMADLYLTGHEHGYRSKDPDKLSNKCQCILNSGFFSINPKDKSIDSGATLIKIDRYNEMLHVLKLIRNENNAWVINGSPKQYSTADHRIEFVKQYENGTQNPWHIKLNEEGSEQRLYYRIISKLFGKHRQKESKTLQKGINSFLMEKEGENFSVTIINPNYIDLNGLPEVIEQDQFSIIIIISKLDNEKYQQTLNKLRMDLNEQILCKKVALIPLLLDF
jgi:calcineurin-like phosphoesterase